MWCYYILVEKLCRDFYCRDTIAVAKDLLGKILVNCVDGKIISGRIVETEAYLCDDPACHASRGMTKRNKVMFGEPGHAYVYFTYGFHYCANFVTQPKGKPEAVLIRALEPLEGIDIMMRNRNKTHDRDLCSGPGKLTQALGIDLSLNGADLLSEKIYVIDDKSNVGEIIMRPRIGIKLAVDELWRFYPLKYKEWVSKS